MITADPTKRAQILDEVQRIVADTAPEGDRDLLRAFASVVLAEMPDSVVFRLPAPALAARLGEYFRFVAHTMPPEVQLYRGLAGPPRGRPQRRRRRGPRDGRPRRRRRTR